MKLFVTKFYQTLILNVATIAAIVVGIVQFAVRAYKENNGPEKVRKVMQTVLKFVDTLVQHSKVYFAEPAAVIVPVRKVSQTPL
jgi:F0F1-type ATP synthase membrane subunit a